MIPQKYISRLASSVRRYFPEGDNRVFIFGSSLRSDVFRDIDVGILGTVDSRRLEQLREELDLSTFPYFVDIVDFSVVGKEFYDSVVHNQTKKWI